ncbi:MAG: hypothetical protein U0798_15135 [Gemmataceae bacterium]
MPGPYCSFDDVSALTKASLGQAGAVALPEHWDEICRKANRAGYSRMIGTLAGRGFTMATIDRWDGRVDYNLRYALAFAFVFGGYRRGENDPGPSAELDRLDKELGNPKYVLMGEDGLILEPDSTAAVGNNQVRHGRNQSFDRDDREYEEWGRGQTFIVPDPHGEGG